MLATSDRPRQAATTNAWGRLPDAVVRDTRLSPAALVLLAYRATFKGNYALNVTALQRQPIVRDGLGRDAIKRALRECRAAGYLKRWQAPPSGRNSFSKAQERLTLPVAGKAQCIVRRGWFDGTLSLNELAAYLYFQAGAGPRTFTPELALRFCWSRPTATKVTRALEGLGLIAKASIRGANGHVKSLGYRATSSPAKALDAMSGNVKIPVHEKPPKTSKIQSTKTQEMSKNQPTKNQPTKNQSTNTKTSLHSLLSSKEVLSSHSAPAGACGMDKQKPEVGRRMSEWLRELKAPKAQR